MSKTTFHLLEFGRIIDRIASFAHSPATREQIDTLAPLGTKEAAEMRLALVEEVRQLSAAGIRLPLAPFGEIAAIIELARPDGSLLTTDELSLLIPVLTISQKMSSLIGYRRDIPLLAGISGDIAPFPDILEPLQRMIGPDGGLLDTASDHLFTLRRSQRHLVGRVRKRLEEIVREREVAIFLQDDFITQRNGRWVIPVRMDSKGMVPGVVHDVSRSGETAFMEPIEVIGMVNELENLNAEEKAEQIRILKEVTGWVREDADRILASYRAIVRVDLLNAIASFADLIDASAPQISSTMELNIKEGRHPILLMMQKDQGSGDIVPLDMSLGGTSDIRSILITGPNTGGKTIAIKSIGLLTLMAQSGIPVPADSRSVFPAAAPIVADIGDEQSIEESLSTFSAHIRKITDILAHADHRTIVLLDELGTGTDPLQGSAIACAILEELMSRGAMILATTHLIDIVAYVQQSPGMLNCAMEFDRKDLQPLYRLTMGEPGQSHALDIARRCGLPGKIIDAAERFAGKRESDFFSLLAGLKEATLKNEALKSELLERQRAIAEKEAGLKQALQSLDALRRETRANCLSEAAALINGTRAELNRILEEARRTGGGKPARERIATIETGIRAELDGLHPKNSVDPATLRPGAAVHVRTLGTDATVLSVDPRNDRVRLRAGSLEMELPLAAISAPENAGTPARPAVKSAYPDRVESTHELRLIGLRVDEALAQLDKYIDDCVLHGLHEVRIVHGKGSGSLMRAVREQLSRDPRVEGFRGGERYEGGEGATIATVRS